MSWCKYDYLITDIAVLFGKRLKYFPRFRKSSQSMSQLHVLHAVVILVRLEIARPHEKKKKTITTRVPAQTYQT